MWVVKAMNRVIVDDEVLLARLISQGIMPIRWLTNGVALYDRSLVAKVALPPTKTTMGLEERLLVAALRKEKA